MEGDDGTGLPGERPASDVRAMLIRLVVGISALVGVLAVAAYAFREELMAVSRWFVTELGGIGLSLVFLVPDAFSVPLPQDAFLAFGLLGGLSFWQVSAWASAGSLIGGALGYGLARQLRHTRWYRRLARGRGREAERWVRRYGRLALAAGALTPLPYSWVCWSCGALGMPFVHFGPVSLLRIVRVVGYLWLIEIGVLHITG